MIALATLIANPSMGPSLARVPNGLVACKPEPTQVEPGWHLVADDLAAVRADHVVRMAVAAFGKIGRNGPPP